MKDGAPVPIAVVNSESRLPLLICCLSIGFVPLLTRSVTLPPVKINVKSALLDYTVHDTTWISLLKG